MRTSHSILDPFIIPLVGPLYRALHIPRRYPPEGIIAVGHVAAIGGAVGFAFSTHVWWAGLLAGLGVIVNHVADMVDGTHARSTGQCRNGGELLDHFTDPLSFSYWMIGLGFAAGAPGLALPAVLAIMATAVLTNLRAKITGNFSLAAFGPTEFKALLVLLGVALAIVMRVGPQHAPEAAWWTLLALGVVGVVTLAVGVPRAVLDVNRRGAAPDDTPWKLRGKGEPET